MSGYELIAEESKTTVAYDLIVLKLTEAGARGPKGDKGEPGSPGTSYLHQQLAESTIWTIPHNLGFKPAVALLSIGGMEIEADILHLSDNTLTATFNTPLAGFARLN